MKPSASGIDEPANCPDGSLAVSLATDKCPEGDTPR